MVNLELYTPHSSMRALWLKITIPSDKAANVYSDVRTERCLVLEATKILSPGRDKLTSKCQTFVYAYSVRREFFDKMNGIQEELSGLFETRKKRIL